jgi:hypothetical protein
MKGNPKSRSERQRAWGNGSIGMQREAESGPTMWERLLTGLSLSEDDAIAILGRKRGGAASEAARMDSPVAQRALRAGTGTGRRGLDDALGR